MRESRTPYAILGLLTWQPMSGYDIKKAIQQSTAHFWSESYGQIYPILRRLASEGLVKPVLGPSGARERQAWAITEEGREELRRWLQAPAEVARVRNERLLKLFFGAQAPPAINRQHVEAMRANAATTRAHCRAVQEQLSGLDGPPDATYWALSARLGEMQSQTVLAWCDEALAAIESVPMPTTKRMSRRRTSSQPGTIRKSNDKRRKATGGRHAD